MSPSDVYVDAAERAEASRLIEASVVHDQPLNPDDRERLIALVSDRAGLSQQAAADRVDSFASSVRHDANATRRAASYASLWIAFSLIFGAIVAMASAVFARIEDDRDAGLARRP